MPVLMDYFRFGARLALAFFIFGTLLLVAFYFTLSPKIALLAYYYTLIAIVVNWFYAAVLLFNYLRRKLALVHLLQTIGLMAINIPAGILYSAIMVTLLTYARITFVNTSGHDIGQLTIRGCQEKEIRDFKNGDSKTRWIKLVSDCQITLEYNSQGVLKKDTVLEHLTSTGGLITTYTIESSPSN
jgi:hypothetical protein